MAATTTSDKLTVPETKDSGFIPDYEFPLPGFIRQLPAWSRVALIIFILVVASLVLRTRSVGQQYWMDEAITVGISSHHLSAIPGIMRQDGSPPLFYLLLHFWMLMVGNGEAATHWLSEIFAVLTIPIGYWGGLKLAGKRAGLITAALMASSAFLDYYSQETRMYALMSLLGLFGTIGFVRGFVFRERRYVILFSLAEAAMLYTHNWALFFGAGSVLSLVVLYRISGDEIRLNLIRDAIYAYVGAAILFVPWLPNFIFQSLHTAAPWNTSPRFGAPVQIAQSVYGGATVAAILVIGAAVGYTGFFRKAERASAEAKIALILFTLVLFTLLLGWIASQITPAWNPRYFAPIVPAIIMFTAIGMSRAGVVGPLTLAVALIFLARADTYAPQHKSDMQDIGGEMGPLMHKGDLVIVGQPEQTPLAYYYLPGGLRFSSTIGPVRDPTFVNWINALSRYRAANPAKVLPPMLNKVKPGQQVLYIRPLTEGVIGWKAPWTSEIRTRSAQWGKILSDDKQLTVEAWAPHNYRGACCVADSAILYVKK
ncbi:MAG TPA: glycosyltransferase family 39 protein [Solirubrobacteraceae bacterium]|nr:glycosyltransferase family 39 protein [Solirubrobacteraceae bacterium]